VRGGHRRHPSGQDLRLSHLLPATADEERCEVRLHDTTLYSSLFRYDDDLLVNPHIFGQPASANPVLHLKRHTASGWFASYAESFEAVWAGAQLWTPGQERT
jgi:hypothetical protein